MHSKDFSWAGILGGLLVDALHFHRRLKNLPYSGWKVGPAGCTSEHPSLHVTFNEGTFVFRSEQAEHQNFFAFRTSCTLGESDSVVKIYRHDFPLSKMVARERFNNVAAGKLS